LELDIFVANNVFKCGLSAFDDFLPSIVLETKLKSHFIADLISDVIKKQKNKKILS